jgi:hypothetical protein
MSLVFGACSDEEKKDDNTFVWEGDIEGYNPLEGDWKHETKSATYGGWRFSKKKILYRLFYDNYGRLTQAIEIAPFEINNTAYKYSADIQYICRYKIVDNKFILYPNLNNDNEAVTLIKVK